MKIFQPDGTRNWGNKVNFVDENNVFVGFNMDQDCCEYADWFISEHPQNTYVNVGDKQHDVSQFVFDRAYFRQVDGGDFDGGGMVIFRLHDGGRELFLHIFNAHNGYYGHGFEFTAGDEKIKEGVL